MVTPPAPDLESVADLVRTLRHSLGSALCASADKPTISSLAHSADPSEWRSVVEEWSQK